jgi:hypothetical protein
MKDENQKTECRMREQALSGGVICELAAVVSRGCRDVWRDGFWLVRDALCMTGIFLEGPFIGLSHLFTIVYVSYPVCRLCTLCMTLAGGCFG